VLCATACTAHAAEPAATPPVATIVQPNATVIRVVDGDTVVVDIDGHAETLRLIGIDTPETVKPNSPVECYGPEASKYTKHLLPKGTPLRLERDVEARDDYGRLLVYIYMAADGTFVNLQLVQQGYATLLTFPPNVAHVDEFIAAARAAQQSDLGLWAACSG
ncbi:MAG: putative nuclease, partial [Ilumatobacteraceae bacterium]|nr:putative nuclease [Ilumatobacteraceae bacterium]